MAAPLTEGAVLLLRPSWRQLRMCHRYKTATIPRQQPRRLFHNSKSLDGVKPYLLADIGEGITECQVIQWFVQPGARVEQFDKICEVQSDKASVEITSRFDGIIKKLYYEPDDMAKVGKPLVDIDIHGEISPEDEALTKVPGGQSEETPNPPPEEPKQPQTQQPEAQPPPSTEGEASVAEAMQEPISEEASAPRRAPLGKHATLATPAVRHLTKQLNIDITDISGTGKDGRVLKEDVQKFASAQRGTKTPSVSPTSRPPSEDKTVPLTPIQSAMFGTMTASLSIPHFLYTTTVDFTSLATLRRKLNKTAPKSTSQEPPLTPLPFILKAVSQTLTAYPLLNSHLDTKDSSKPRLTFRSSHDIGIAVDTPRGLLVPVVRDVQEHSIVSLAAEIRRLSEAARAGKLTSAQLSGATFTVSNIGSVGGGVVAPVIVSPMVGILGVGRSKVVPGFERDEETGALAQPLRVVAREECVFSWSADHRVVDGAMVARAAEEMRGLLEGIEEMVVRMR